VFLADRLPGKLADKAPLAMISLEMSRVADPGPTNGDCASGVVAGASTGARRASPKIVTTVIRTRSPFAALPNLRMILKPGSPKIITTLVCDYCQREVEIWEDPLHTAVQRINDAVVKMNALLCLFCATLPLRLRSPNIPDVTALMTKNTMIMISKDRTTIGLGSKDV
jgi:hypothetical protein